MLAAELPQSLQEEFERTALLLNDRDGVQQAFVEAIELWLTQQHQKIVEMEARLNNQAFDAMRAELEQKYFGQWIVIAHGKFLGAASTPEQMNEVAPTARHRIMMKMGQDHPKAVEFGWQMTLA